MRLLIAGGGTGGHVAPALAVAHAWAEPQSGEVLFVGAQGGLEERMVPPTGYPLELLKTSGIKGLGPLSRLLALVRIVPALWRSLKIQRRFNPSVVLGVGGYASAPAMLAAFIGRRPRVILEPNSIPGLTNRLLSRVAQRACVHFSSTAQRLGAIKSVHTGNPIRPDIAAAAKTPEAIEGLRSLLVFGGSQGARTINRAACGALGLLAAEGFKPNVRHQAGGLDLEQVRADYRDAGLEIEVEPFIDDMAAAYSAADLAICRAGASAVSELAAVGLPSILVPYPYAADDHQTGNARELAQSGAAILLSDEQCTARRLAELIRELSADPQRLRSMSRAALELGRPDAAQRVADVCQGLAKGGDDVR
ncbi:MAG: undecaprenyldiphospho-muramoylpentapeptide beta-N-acetylglucosaminyltransferase [Candidatus Alcyoniella australis]|nr:undecaprenyldiphospho-muramoylpentapeptide beta-N-acetylglucosaminyltransferase [Candidatus Alcyoniella australis]